MSDALTKKQFAERNSGIPSETIDRYWEALGKEDGFTKQLRDAGILKPGQHLRELKAQKAARSIVRTLYPGETNRIPEPVMAWLRAIWGRETELEVAEVRYRYYLEKRKSGSVKGRAADNYLLELKKGTAQETLWDKLAATYPDPLPESLLLLDGARLEAVNRAVEQLPKKVKDSTYCKAFQTWKEGRAHQTPAAASGFGMQTVFRAFVSTANKDYAAVLRAAASRKNQDLKKNDRILLAYFAFLHIDADIYDWTYDNLKEGVEGAEQIYRASPFAQPGDDDECIKAHPLPPSLEQYVDRLCERLKHLIMTSREEGLGSELAALSARRTVYTDSLLPRLEALFLAEGEKKMTEALYRLIRCLLSGRKENVWTEKGAALRDPSFLSGPLLSLWLREGGVTPAALTALASPALFACLDEEERTAPGETPGLAWPLVQQLNDLAGAPGPDDGEEEWEQALRCILMADALLLRCPKRIARDGAGEYDLLPQPARSLFRARLLLKEAELWLRRPPSEAPLSDWKKRLEELGAERIVEGELRDAGLENALKKRAGAQRALHGLTRARACVRSALEILGFCRLQELSAAAVDALERRACLLESELLRSFARQEAEELLPEDALEACVRPSREALARAKALDRDDADRTETALEEDCSRRFWFADRDAADEASGVTPFPDRLRCREPGEAAAWEEEWRRWGGGTAPVPKVPKLLVPGGEASRPAPLLLPVFSNVFDSTYGADPANRSSVEMNLIQLVLSGKNVLFQAPQLADNAAILDLIRSVPGFDLLCRNGRISVSLYGSYGRLLPYVNDNLKKPDARFHFSAAACLADMGTREIMRRLLAGDPGGLRDVRDARQQEELLQLAESWRMMDELFRTSDVRRMHQNAALRFPPRDIAAEGSRAPEARELWDSLQDRLKRLKRQAEGDGSKKAAEELAAMLAYAESWGQITERSVYLARIRELREALPGSGTLMDKLELVLNDAYTISSGRRSCRDILLTVCEDSDLILRDSGEQRAWVSANTAFLTEQVRRKTEKSGFSWLDVAELAEIILEILAAESGPDGKRSEDARAQLRERYTGARYAPRPDGELYAEAFTAETTVGSYSFSGEKTDAADPAAVTEHSECYRLESGAD